MSDLQNTNYLKFVRQTDKEVEIKAKTQIWHVISYQRGNMLGEIKWYTNWRQYCFFPVRTTTFNHTCLLEISEACWQLTRDHRAGRSK
jgi:hypothetical protein